MGAKRRKAKAIQVQNLPESRRLYGRIPAEQESRPAIVKANPKEAKASERAREITLAAGQLGAEERQIAAQEEVETELARLFRSMHLMSERDIDATMTRVFKAMVQMGQEGPVGSTELSRQSGLNRITVIHHLKRLENAGVVVKQETKYSLRVSSMEELMDEMREGMMKQFEEMDRMARDIDREFMGDIERFSHGRARKREEKRE